MITAEQIAARLRQIAADDDTFPYACHEVGHLLLAIHFGLAAELSLIPDADSHGHCLLDLAAMDNLPPIDAAAIAVAGAVAEARQRKLKQVWLVAADSENFERTITRAPAADRARVRSEAKQFAIALVIRNWKLIDRLARELHVKQTLTSEEAKAIINEP